jgi:hypothetical protein
MTTPVVTPAVNIRYPFYKDHAVKVWAYVVDKDSIDPLLMQQKEHILSLYRTAGTKMHTLWARKRARQDALELLQLFRPLWIMFEYEYKYHELFQMINEYSID